MRLGKLEVQTYLAALVSPVVAFGLPVWGVWNFHTAESVAEWMMLAVVWVPYWLAAWQAPIWHVVGLPFRKICPALFIAGVALSVPDLLAAPVAWDHWASAPYEVAWQTLSGVFLAGMAIQFARGSEPPRRPVQLHFPFDEGRYPVVQGGAEILGNRHVSLLDGDKPEARGQAYGVDLVEVNRFGFRAAGLLPRDPEKYVIFGRTVRAPIDGRVAQVEAELPDHPPPQHDPERPNGNHVWLTDGEVEILLAHLKEDSIRVEPDDEVEAGDPLGEIGNSGRTTEPHLHIHAQRPAQSGPRMSGEPLPVTFDGTFPRQAMVIGAG
jgi:hypothetical protein